MKAITSSFNHNILILFPLLQLAVQAAAECEYCDKNCQDFFNNGPFSACVTDKVNCCANRNQQNQEKNRKDPDEAWKKQDEAFNQQVKKSQEDFEEKRRKSDEDFEKSRDTHLIIFGVLAGVICCLGIICTLVRYSMYGGRRVGGNMGFYRGAQVYPGGHGPYHGNQAYFPGVHDSYMAV